MSINQAYGTAVQMTGAPQLFVSVVRAATQLPARCVKLFLRWREQAETKQVLLRLDERRLRDIGLSRADLEQRYPASPPDFLSRSRI